MTDKEKERIAEYVEKLKSSKNMILRGAPGTGKSYLAKQIAAYIITGGADCDYTKLNGEQRKQVEFVQFHPSYDYTDFVEGLRPVLNKSKTGESEVNGAADAAETDTSNTLGFKLQDGVFKRFVDLARKEEFDAKLEEAFEEFTSREMKYGKEQEAITEVEVLRQKKATGST